jgi:hypothetical protein
MAILPNPRHERFAQALASGKTADEAYADAGYARNRCNAARLKTNDNVGRRVAELQAGGAKAAELTVESICAELEEARRLAERQKQTGPMVNAIMGKAKVCGLLVEKQQHIGQYFISDAPMSAEQWEAEYCQPHPDHLMREADERCIATLKLEKTALEREVSELRQELAHRNAEPKLLPLTPEMIKKRLPLLS